jgi:uncharacterized protein (DUF58 family)
MVVRVNPQLHRLLGITALALFLGVIFARAELVLMAIPALLAIFVGLAGERSAAYEVAHEVSTSRLFEGEVLQVTITIIGRSAVPCIEVLDPLASSLEVVSDSHHKAFSLKAGETVQWTYVVRGLRRDHFTLGHLRVRIHGRAGLLVREAQHLLPKPCTIYPHITPLQRVVHPPHTQAYAGNYVASALGEGIEFGNIRPFAPGDRTKRILPPRALIVAFSPLVDERFAPTLHDLVVRGFPVVLLAISPVDVTRAILEPSAVTDITCRLWALERAALIEELQRHGIVVIDWHLQDPLEMVLSAITRRQHLRRRAS